MISRKIFLVLIIGIMIIPIGLSAQQKRNDLKSDLQTARRFEQMRNYEQALEIYLALEKQYPDDKGVFQGMQRCYLALEMFDKQISLLQERLAKEPQNLELYEWLGRVLSRSGDKDGAKEYWEKIIQMNPEDVNRYKTVANLYYREGMADEAVATYERARERKKDENLFARELAQMHEFQMNYSKAIDEYLKYLNSDNRHFGYVSGKIIQLCEKEGIWNNAIAQLQEKLSQNSDNNELRRLLGDIYLRSGQAQLGLDQYILYEEKARTAGQFLFQYAQRCDDEKEFETAVLAYAEVVTNHPKSPFRDRAILQKASTLASLGRYQEALNTYDSFISESKGKNAFIEDSYLGKGDIYLFNLKQTEKALEAYEKLLEDFPKGQHRFTVNFRIAKVYFVQGKMEKVKEQLLKVQKMTNNAEINEQAMFELANLALLQGDLDGAGKVLSEMLKKYPRGKYTNDALRWSFFLSENQQNEKALQKYLEALKNFRQMKYDLAISGFEELINNYSESGLADDAILQIAEIYREMANYEKAVENYNRLMETFSESELCPESQMRIGDLYASNDDYRQAKEMYEKVILDYPESIQAGLVRKKIQKISGKIR